MEKQTVKTNQLVNGEILDYLSLKEELGIVRGVIRFCNSNKEINSNEYDDNGEPITVLKPCKEVYPYVLYCRNENNEVVATSLLTEDKFNMFRLQGLQILNSCEVKIVNTDYQLGDKHMIMFAIRSVYLLSEDI